MAVKLPKKIQVAINEMLPLAIEATDDSVTKFEDIRNTLYQVRELKVLAKHECKLTKSEYIRVIGALAKRVEWSKEDLEDWDSI